MKPLLFALLALGLCGCLRITDIPEDPVPVPKVLAPQVQELDQPDSYRVQIQIPQQAQIIHRSLKDNPDSKRAITLQVQNGVLTDEQVEAGSHYVYEMGVLQDGEFTVLKTEEVQIPKDRWIDQEVVLSQDQTWTESGRLFLGPNGVITTNGFHLVIRADKLISQGGLIRTFPPGAQAVPGQPGKSGGTVQILARTGNGNLRFEFRGQRGGNGSDGVAIAMDIPPFPGGGNPNIVFGKKTDCPQCFSRAGAEGGRGQDGFQGGSSGRGEIRINEDHQLIAQPIFEPGQGGAGGSGGAGQPVGGRVTAPGPRGQSGSPGPTGFIENFCFHDLRGSFCW